MNAERILGIVFLIIAVFDLIRKDWLGFAIMSLTGIALTVNLGKIGLPRGIEITLAAVISVLVIIRLAMLFSS
jgi:hypothetical protein